jgi:transcriptional regulator GlxA family with amidase domain
MAGKTPAKSSKAIGLHRVGDHASPSAVSGRARDPGHRPSPRPTDHPSAAGGATGQGRVESGQDPALLRRLLRAKDRMDAASHEEWPVHRLARVSRVSEAHFARSFKEAFGIPPHRYLLTRRIERAKTLLRDTVLSVTDIAFQTGWQSLGTFGRTFRDITGESPGELRAREQAARHALEEVPACFVSAAYRPDLTIAVSEKRRQEAADSIPPDETQT